MHTGNERYVRDSVTGSANNNPYSKLLQIGREKYIWGGIIITPHASIKNSFPFFQTHREDHRGLQWNILRVCGNRGDFVNNL